VAVEIVMIECSSGWRGPARGAWRSKATPELFQNSITRCMKRSSSRATAGSRGSGGGGSHRRRRRRGRRRERFRRAGRRLTRQSEHRNPAQERADLDQTVISCDSSVRAALPFCDWVTRARSVPEARFRVAFLAKLEQGMRGCGSRSVLADPEMRALGWIGDPRSVETWDLRR
jgi:hypothetical protein